jgi:hypothetical protein
MEVGCIWSVLLQGTRSTKKISKKNLGLSSQSRILWVSFLNFNGWSMAVIRLDFTNFFHKSGPVADKIRKISKSPRICNALIGSLGSSAPRRSNSRRGVS